MDNKIESDPNSKLQTARKRALRTTFICALLCAIPLSFLYYVSTNYGSPEHSQNIETPPFLMNQKNGGFFTNQSLLGNVTLVLYFPEDCDQCQEFLGKVSNVFNWTKKNLKTLEHFEESDLEFQRVLVSSNPNAQLVLNEWILVEESQQVKEDLEKIFAATESKLVPAVIMFGRFGKIKGFVPLQEFIPQNVKRLLSKINFNSAMDEYLSERTFFGPKKNTDKN